MLTLFNEHQNMTIMNTSKKSYSTPMTSMQPCRMAQIICGSETPYVSPNNGVTQGGGTGSNPGAGL